MAEIGSKKESIWLSKVNTQAKKNKISAVSKLGIYEMNAEKNWFPSGIITLQLSVLGNKKRNEGWIDYTTIEKTL